MGSCWIPLFAPLSSFTVDVKLPQLLPFKSGTLTALLNILGTWDSPNRDRAVASMMPIGPIRYHRVRLFDGQVNVIGNEDAVHGIEHGAVTEQCNTVYA